ncbi:MAG: tyrosine-type recombinase/integrase [Dehalococcoidia bacterium]|nr:tyrosine-type recombinase/integrase [Dehalococcoidia bacterium]
MTTHQTAVQRYRRPRGQYPKTRDSERRPKPLPEYLEAHEVNALIRAAPNSRAALLFLVQWRAGLRVSEALALEVRDLSLDSGLPTIHVRRGKGAKPRIVPVHPELHSALVSLLQFGNIAQGDRLIKASRSEQRHL